MNNNKNAKFSQTTTSFFPKQSFNKGVNMSLIKSENFKNCLKINENDTAKIEQFNQYIKKILRSNNKDIDEGANDSFSSKFDVVTYKTINSKIKYD